MDINKVYEELQENLINSKIFLNEPMSKHTSFKIGGNADIYIKVKAIDDVIYIKKYVSQNNIPLSIVGNGSNILVKDKGIRGITVSMEIERTRNKTRR